MGITYSAPGAAAVVDPRRLRQFDSVRVLEDLSASAVMFLDDEIRPSFIPAGASGAIIDVYDDEQGLYEVELTEPIPALATLRRSQIERR